MSHQNNFLIFLVLTILLLSCKQSEPGSISYIREVTLQIDDNRLANADKTPGDWLSNGRNYYEDRFSLLDQITKKNVKRLGLVWSIGLGSARGIEATPIVADGIMFLSGAWSKVYAINVRSGKLIWTYDPKVPGYNGEKACCDVVNRGVALLADDHYGVIPDLGYTTEATHGILKDIVLRGLFEPKGMPNFSNRLSEKDVTDIQNYILAAAKEKIGKPKK